MTFDVLSIETIERVAAKIFRSGILSSNDFRTEDHVFAVILAGQELGLKPMQSVRCMGFVKGKLSLSADLQIGLCVRSGACKFFRLVESTAERAVYETQRDGSPSTVTLMWTIEQARTAGLLGNGTWRAHPAAMLRARCGAALARAVYPDLVAGIYDPDEAAEIEREDGTDREPPAAPAPAALPLAAAVSNPAAVSPTASELADEGATESESPLERSALWRLQVGLGDEACTTVSTVGKLWQELSRALHEGGFETRGRRLVGEHLKGLGYELASDELQAVLARTYPPPIVDFLDALARVAAVPAAGSEPPAVDGVATTGAVAKCLLDHRDRLDAHQRRAVARIATRKLTALGVQDAKKLLGESLAAPAAASPAGTVVGKSEGGT